MLYLLDSKLTPWWFYNGLLSQLDYAQCAQELFADKALDEIYRASAGIPRMINRICEKALLYAYQRQKRLIDDYMIKFVVEHELLIV